MGDSILEFESLQMIVNQYDAKKQRCTKSKSSPMIILKI